MSVWESILTALFCIAVVFIVLIALIFLLQGFAFILGFFTNKNSSGSAYSQSNLEISSKKMISEKVLPTGTLRLENVDEPTAAMIMAIVSHESGCPLSELKFRSIKLVGKERK